MNTQKKYLLLTLTFIIILSMLFLSQGLKTEKTEETVFSVSNIISEKEFSTTTQISISGCGVLDAENSLYSLAKNVESTGECFSINASNVMLDCQGHYIRYNSAGSQAYGIYSTSNSTKIKNCIIMSGDLNGMGGAGIYFVEAVNGEIYNNKIIMDKDDQEGILLEESENVYIYENEFNISGPNSNAIYSESSNLLKIEDNEIISSSNDNSIYFEFSDYMTIINNFFNTSGGDGSSIFMDSSSYSNIFGNTIFSTGNSQTALYASSSANSNITDNTISTSEENSHGIHLEYFTSGNLLRNNISTSGDGAYAFSITLDTSNNNFYKNKIQTQGEEGNGFDISSESNTNTFSENEIIISGDFANAVSQDGSNTNVFNKNSFKTLGQEGNGFWLYDSANTKIQENSLNTSGANSPALLLDKGTNSEINGNTFITSGENSHGIKLDALSNSNTFSLNNIETSGSMASGIFFSKDTTDNSFTNFKIKTLNANTYSTFISGSGNNFQVLDSILNSPKGLFINTGISSGNWDFINTPLTKFWSNSSGGNLNVMWYLSVFTNYDDGRAASNVNVIAWDEEEVQKFSLMTGSNGETPKQALKEYTQFGPTEIVYHDYLIESSLLEKKSSKQLTMTENKNISFIFPAPSGGSSKKTTPECIPEWDCGNWGECIEGKQSRICTDKNNCEIESGKKSKDVERDCTLSTKKWKTKNTLFDVNLEVLDRNEDGLLLGTISLINIGIPGEVIARVNYKIRNSKNEIVYEEDEVVPVRTQMEFIKEIDTLSLPDEEYTWTVELSYDGQTEPAQAGDSFTIGKKKFSKTIWIIIAAIVTMSTIFFIRRNKNTTDSDSVKEQITPPATSSQAPEAKPTPTSNLTKNPTPTKPLSTTQPKTPTKTPAPTSSPTKTPSI
jgi:hypothetical protein